MSGFTLLCSLPRRFAPPPSRGQAGQARHSSLITHLRSPMRVSVIGGGTMGNGIAHVFAQSGHDVTIIDVAQERLDLALKTIDGNLSRQVKKEAISEAQKAEALGRIRTETDLAAGVRDADLVVEAA